MRAFLPIFIAFLFLSFIDGKGKRPDAHYKLGSVVTYVHVAPDKSVRKTISNVTSVTVTGDRTRFTFKYVYLNEVNDTGRIGYDYYFMDKKNFWYQLKHPYFWGITDGTVETMEGDSLVFPFDMKIGDSLPTAYNKNAWTNKYSSGTDNHFYFNRKVTAVDTIPTPMGKIPAFRVEFKDSHYYKYNYPQMKLDSEYTEIVIGSEWFSPEYGIVKWQTEGKNGASKTVLQSIQ